MLNITRPVSLITFAILVTLLFARKGASAPLNPVQIENHRRGSAQWRLANVATNHEIEGYASLASVASGDPITIFVNTADREYTMTVFRMGYYGGLGGRQMTRPVTRKGVAQPIPTPDPLTGLTECQWTDGYVLRIPRNWVSGFYLVKLAGKQSKKEHYVIFVVRDDTRPAALMFQSATSTSQAYNAWGGKSLYSFNSSANTPAVKVSFNRPYDDGDGAGKFLTWEFDMVAFLEQEGYDVVYSTSTDTHENASELTRHQGFLSIGHDEYWSYEMRQNVTMARDAGVNLGFFSADDCSWQIRFEPSTVDGTPDRTQVAYKEQWRKDPYSSNPSTYYLVTGSWSHPRYSYNPQPQDALIGARQW